MLGQSSTIRVNDVHLNVVETGSGPTLLFLHYWGGSSRTWAPVIEKLSNFSRCIAIDFRGWGGSSKEATDYELLTLAHDVIGVIGEFNLAELTIVGHSMGGKVAQLVAAQHPAGLKRLILLAPAPPTGNDVPDGQRQEMLASYQTREGAETAIGILSALPLSAAYREQVIEDTLSGSQGAKRAWTERGMVENISEQASKITVPVRVIVGGADKIEPEASLRAAFGKVIPAAEFIVIPGVGHLTPLEAAPELAGAIRAAQTA